jgi:hypothetical protein
LYDNRDDFVADEEVKDGSYLLNLQMAPFENDASPSKPVLYCHKREIINLKHESGKLLQIPPV